MKLTVILKKADAEGLGGEILEKMGMVRSEVEDQVFSSYHLAPNLDSIQFGDVDDQMFSARVSEALMDHGIRPIRICQKTNSNAGLTPVSGSGGIESAEDDELSIDEAMEMMGLDDQPEEEDLAVHEAMMEAGFVEAEKKYISPDDSAADIKKELDEEERQLKDVWNWHDADVAGRFAHAIGEKVRWLKALHKKRLGLEKKAGKGADKMTWEELEKAAGVSASTEVSAEDAFKRAQRKGYSGYYFIVDKKTGKAKLGPYMGVDKADEVHAKMEKPGTHWSKHRYQVINKEYLFPRAYEHLMKAASEVEAVDEGPTVSAAAGSGGIESDSYSVEEAMRDMGLEASVEVNAEEGMGVDDALSALDFTAEDLLRDAGFGSLD